MFKCIYGKFMALLRFSAVQWAKHRQMLPLAKTESQCRWD